MAFTEKKILGYECERCGAVIEAESPWTDDYPEGYYLTIRRVTEAQNHYLSDIIYLCSKECLIDFVTYGISAATEAWRPVGRVELSKKRHGRQTSPHAGKTHEDLVLENLPARSSGSGIPIDPDHTTHPGGEASAGSADSVWCEQHQRFEMFDDNLR